MANDKYTIKYIDTFIKQFDNILKYFIHKLKNKIAAERFYQKTITEIEKRRENPESYERYASARKRKDIYYRIYVKNYTIFYIVNGNTMEIRRIIQKEITRKDG